MANACIILSEDKKTEIALPMGFASKTAHFPSGTVMGIEELALYTLKQINQFYQEEVVKNSELDLESKQAAFGLRVYMHLIDFNWMNQNLTLCSSCFIANNPLLLGIISIVLCVREEYHGEAVTDKNRKEKCGDFSDSLFGELLESFLRQNDCI